MVVFEISIKTPQLLSNKTSQKRLVKRYKSKGFQCISTIYEGKKKAVMAEHMQAHLNETFTDGGEQELEQAIDLFATPLFQYCNTIVCDYYEAQDITQNVFIKAYQNRHKFAKGTSLSAWLYKIAYRTCLDHLRRKRFAFIADSHPKMREEDTRPPEDSLSEEMSFALGRLTPKERAVLYGRVVEEQEYRELAAILHCSEAALRKRYERAKRKLALVFAQQKADAKRPNQEVTLGSEGRDSG